MIFGEFRRFLPRIVYYDFYENACLVSMVDDSTFERVEEFKNLRTTLTNQNSIAEEIKSRLKSGNACYHSVQNLLSSRFPSKNVELFFGWSHRILTHVPYDFLVMGPRKMAM